MRHIPVPLSNGLITRSGLEPNFSCAGRLKKGFWVCLRNSVRWMEFG